MIYHRYNLVSRAAPKEACKTAYLPYCTYIHCTAEGVRTMGRNLFLFIEGVATFFQVGHVIVCDDQLLKASLDEHLAAWVENVQVSFK